VTITDRAAGALQGAADAALSVKHQARAWRAAAAARAHPPYRVADREAGA